MEDGRHSQPAAQDSDPDDPLRAEYAKTARRLAQALDENIRLKRELSAMRATLSWKVTAPLRQMRGVLGRFRQGPKQLASAAANLYRSAPLPMRARLKLHQVLAKASPSGYERLRRAAGAEGPAPVEATTARVDAADIVGNAAYRAGFRRLVADLAAHTERYGPITHALVLPFFAIGGAQVTAQNFARAISARRQASVLIAADKSIGGAPPAAIAGALAIDLSDYFAKADGTAREHLLLAVLKLMKPHVVHIINSEIAWRMLIQHGEHVRAFARVFGAIFAFQYDWKSGDKIGYAATFLQRALPLLDGVLTDNRRFVDDAIAAYGLDAERAKFRVVYNTTDGISPETLADGAAFAAALPERIGAAERLSVLWAGRLDAEKRPELLLAIAKARPDIDFHVYGERVVDKHQAFAALPNLVLQGPYESAAEVMARRAHHAMIFTSRWEGLANVLIEFGAQGLPIVAATVGGVGELITPETGYPVSERPEAADYIAALDAIRADPTAAAARAENLLGLIGRRHGRAQFEESVAQIEGYFA